MVWSEWAKGRSTECPNPKRMEGRRELAHKTSSVLPPVQLMERTVVRSAGGRPTGLKKTRTITRRAQTRRLNPAANKNFEQNQPFSKQNQRKSPVSPPSKHTWDASGGLVANWSLCTEQWKPATGAESITGQFLFGEMLISFLRWVLNNQDRMYKKLKNLCSKFGSQTFWLVIIFYFIGGPVCLRVPVSTRVLHLTGLYKYQFQCYVLPVLCSRSG